MHGQERRPARSAARRIVFLLAAVPSPPSCRARALERDEYGSTGKHVAERNWSHR